MSEKYDEEHYEQDLRLVDLVIDESVIEATEFVGCTLHGPAVLVVADIELRYNTFEGSTDAVLWEVPEDRPRVIGAILVRACTFRGCTFKHVGLAGSPSTIAKLRAEMEEG